jgi:hypothetical protein
MPRKHSPCKVEREVHPFKHHHRYPPVNIWVSTVDLITIDPATLYANFVLHQELKHPKGPRSIALVNTNHRPLDSYDLLSIRTPLHVPGYFN